MCILMLLHTVRVKPSGAYMYRTAVQAAIPALRELLTVLAGTGNMTSVNQFTPVQILGDARS